MPAAQPQQILHCAERTDKAAEEPSPDGGNNKHRGKQQDIGALLVKAEVPLNNDSQIFPRAEKILINKAGTKMNDTGCTAVRMIAIGGILFFFAVFSLLFSLFIPTLPFQ